MGAWGTGVFEDDSACDLLYDAMETDAQTFIAKAIGHKGSDYLDYEECQEVIVSGAILDSVLNGAKYEHVTEGYDEWLRQQNKEELEKFRADIVAGLKVVLSDKSELNELWSENEEDYLVWRAGVEKIVGGIGCSC